MLNRSASLAMSTSVLKALPGKLDINRHSPRILYANSIGKTGTTIASKHAILSTNKGSDDESYIKSHVALDNAFIHESGGPRRSENLILLYALTESADQPVHPLSLISPLFFRQNFKILTNLCS